MDNLIMDIDLTNETGTEPVTVADAKNWLKIDVPDDDTALLGLITAARQLCENYLNISLIEREITAFLYIGLGEMYLPYGPVQDVISVETGDGKQPIENYVLKYEQFKALDPTPEVKIKYNAGYNGNIPEVFRTAILNQVAHLYENRGDDAEAAGLSPQARMILRPYRRVT